ncbi:aromatic amino acid beta-eliminating lyase/threonine aldolase [Parvibaculum lavamentivorans DS-1]|uniref:Aromatic amino acid beta-eliminating lyase/threonine aldolase n=1 Tax=Parvibaculum lavamentivorans (strain DS-1 / DSM 13023 / NCIMB 13966) TaxID=402881 RepID=A7HWZ4_PARL1|nr:beta-eliminating lyase-related protein [Parvibaculum lavamentivorans]ABS64427.1 aromatic amino acid beta-eliminating lyase/threonine aldolase [Parvibaculum lavamentivorans DS-1]
MTRTGIDLRSDLMTPGSAKVAAAMQAAALRPPAMGHGEDPDERALMELMAAELGVEAVLLVPTCTMANQIAIRLHLPEGGRLASSALAHVVTVEDRATALTGVARQVLPDENGHPSPAAVAGFLAERAPGEATLVWLENTHMLAAGSVMPTGWQSDIGATCRAAGSTLHLDGSRLWNAAVAQNAPLSVLMAGCDTAAISLNKAIGAPVGSVLAGSRSEIDEALRWRDAMGGGWRPIGAIAAAARAALEGWRDRLETDAAMASTLARAIAGRLGDLAVQPAQTNLVFLNRPSGDAAQFVDSLARHGVQVLKLTPALVRLAIHGGVRVHEVETIATAVATADTELAATRGA